MHSKPAIRLPFHRSTTHQHALRLQLLEACVQGGGVDGGEAGQGVQHVHLRKGGGAGGQG